MVRPISERINDLLRVIQDESRSEVDKLMAGARSTEAEILDSGARQADELRSEIIGKAKSDAYTRKEEALAEAAGKARMEWLKKREELISEVFENARKRINSFVEDPRYADALPALVKEAVTQLDTENVVLHFDQRSRELLREEDLRQIATETHAKLSVGDDISEGIGVIAEFPDGHRFFNNTLELRLERQMTKRRAGVLDILMGRDA